jgi:hypothetical protein
MRPVRLYSRHHHFSRGSLSHLLESGELEVTDVILRNAPLASLDMPVSARAATLIVLGGVGLPFVGSISGRTYAQTVVCREGPR